MRCCELGLQRQIHIFFNYSLHNPLFCNYIIYSHTLVVYIVLLSRNSQLLCFSFHFIFSHPRSLFEQHKIVLVAMAVAVVVMGDGGAGSGLVVDQTK